MKTIAVKSENPETQGPYIIINEDDFDPEVHKKYKGELKEAQPKEEGNDEDEDATEVEFTSKEVADLAEDAGLELEPGKGSGKDGKYNKKDVEKAIDALGSDEDEDEDEEDFE